MKLSKNWTRVTPLSKYLAMTLFIAFPFLGFFIGSEYGKQVGMNTAVETLLVVPTTSQEMGILPEQTITGASTQTQTGQEITVNGPIQAVDTSCSHDGVCKVKVANYWVITNLGGDPSPEVSKARGSRGTMTLNGQRIGGISTDMVGKSASVFAKKMGNSTLTLYGNSAYYLKISN